LDPAIVEIAIGILGASEGSCLINGMMSGNRQTISQIDLDKIN